jgi:hypothetical protein
MAPLYQNAPTLPINLVSVPIFSYFFNGRKLHATMRGYEKKGGGFFCGKDYGKGWIKTIESAGPEPREAFSS